MLVKLFEEERFNEVEERLNKMQKRADEFCQTRSNFQLEKFVAGDEYTPISKFRHVAHNSYIAMQEVRRMMIDKERKLRKIKRLEECIKFQTVLEDKMHGDIKNLNTEYDPHFMDYDLDILEVSRQLEDIDIRIKGLLKEIDYMEAICDELEKREIAESGSGFTAEKFQAAEPEYWRTRLINQMHRSQSGQQLGVGEGNYMSMLMASEDPILPDSKNQIGLIELHPNTLAVESMLSKPGLKDKFLVEAKPEDEQKKLAAK